MFKPLDLTSRVAVVIGGTSGIGRAIARGLAEAGADVVPTGRRQELANEVCTQIEELGRRSMPTVCDVTSRASIDALRDAAAAKFGRVDILVNCAGMVNRKPVAEVSEEEWEAVQDTNVTGMVRACASFHNLLKASGHGRVINIASISGFASLINVGAYAASKAGVLALTRSLAVEWAGDGINANSIVPGIFRTDLNYKTLDGTDRGRELLMRIPMKRFGKAEEIAGAAVLLASDSASFITGQSITIDGGFMASACNS